MSNSKLIELSYYDPSAQVRLSAYWFNAKQLVTCLKALSGTVTLGIAQGGMLTLATQYAYYLQNAMRPEAQKKTQKAAQPAAAKAA